MFVTTPAALLLLFLLGAHSTPTRVKRADDVNPLSAVVQQLTNEITDLKARQSANEARLAKLELRVAFTAAFSQSTLQAPTAGPYKFDAVVFNDGDAYNPVTGIFTAPVGGVYMFSFQVFTHDSERPMSDIKVNGNAVRRMAFDTRNAGNDEESGMTSLTASLTEGDQVWVENGYGDSRSMDLFGGVHTFFDGALLYAN